MRETWQTFNITCSNYSVNIKLLKIITELRVLLTVLTNFFQCTCQYWPHVDHIEFKPSFKNSRKGECFVTTYCWITERFMVCLMSLRRVDKFYCHIINNFINHQLLKQKKTDRKLCCSCYSWVHLPDTIPYPVGSCSFIARPKIHMVASSRSIPICPCHTDRPQLLACGKSMPKLRLIRLH